MTKAERVLQLRGEMQTRKGVKGTAVREGGKKKSINAADTRVVIFRILPEDRALEDFPASCHVL